MTDQELETLESAHAYTTAGTWKLWGMEVRADPVGDSNVDTSILVARTAQEVDGHPRTGDANFIRLAHSMVPALVAEVRRLRELEAKVDAGLVRVIHIHNPGAIRSAALEEAANVAEEHLDTTEGPDIAGRIRALAKEGE